VRAQHKVAEQFQVRPGHRHGPVLGLGPSCGGRAASESRASVKFRVPGPAGAARAESSGLRSDAGSALAAQWGCRPGPERTDSATGTS
jgi:hypothetical protein